MVADCLLSFSFLEWLLQRKIKKKKLPENKQSGDLPPNQRQDICAGRQVCRHVDQSDVSRGGFREAAGGAERIKRARRRPWANSEEVRVCPREEDQLLHSTLKQTFLSEICGLSSLSTLTVSSGIFLFCVSIYIYIYINIFFFFFGRFLHFFLWSFIYFASVIVLDEVACCCTCCCLRPRTQRPLRRWHYRWVFKPFFLSSWIFF